MNSIEAGRIRLGLTRTQALSLVGAKPTWLSVLTRPDNQVAPAFLARMREAVAAYDTWSAAMLARLDQREAEGQASPLTMLELSELTGVREVSLIALRSRGALHGELVRGRSGMEYVYPVPEVRRFINSNSEVLRDGGGRQRGHLAAAFLRHYERQHHSPAAQLAQTA